MKLTQIRNATVLVEYAEVRFLMDPMLSPVGTLPPCHSRIRPETWNPLHELPCPVEMLLQADAVIATHLHPGHFDQQAAQLLPKDLPIFAQNQRDAEILQYYGFRQIRILGQGTEFSGVTLTRTPGQHGNWEEEILKQLGSVCGVVFQAPGEPCLYATGDTVWYPGVAQVTKEFHPDVVLANAGANMGYRQQVNMGKEDILALHQALPSAVIVATHMEDLNHWTLSRAELKAFALENGFGCQLLTPQNGECVVFDASWQA